MQDGNDEEEDEGAGVSVKKRNKRGDVDMEVTFGPALEGLAQRLADKKKAKEAKTIWEQLEQRRRWVIIKSCLDHCASCVLNTVACSFVSAPGQSVIAS
jgi:hypothetical protein